MINGITVLSKYSMTKTPDWGIKTFIIILFLGFVIGLVLSIKEKDKIHEWFLCGILCTTIAMIPAIIFIGVTTFFFSVPNGEYRYKVTISDSVSFKEFNDHYNLIDQDGKIFIITTKDN